jgi:hypothetical protein
MLISGGADELWPSSVFADRIMGAVPADPAVHVHLNYPAAGHFVFGVPSVPAPTEERLTSPGTEDRVARSYTLDLGGTEAADEAANLSDWPAAISFIRSH